MKERIDKELELLGQHFPHLEYRADGQWVRIPAYPLPSGWTPQVPDVVFQIPTAFPGTPPYGFYSTSRAPVQWTDAGQLYRARFDPAPVRRVMGILFMVSCGLASNSDARSGPRLQPPLLGQRVRESISGGRMSSEAVLELPRTVHEELQRHLLRKANGNEEAAFVFAQHSAMNNRFTYVESFAVPPEGFVVQLPYHFELTDETRARIIK